MVHTLVQLGKLLSIETLAEGVEQPRELSMLQGEQCDSGQGFLFARPLEAAATETFLENWAQNAAPANNGAPASARLTSRSGWSRTSAPPLARAPRGR